MAKSKPSNNVFKFVDMFEENLSQLEQTKIISRIDDKGNKSKKSYQPEEASEIVEVGKIFLSNFKDYLRRGDYTKSKNDIDLVEYKLAGRTNADVLAYWNINQSTLRMRYARLTKKVYRSAFNRETVPDDLVWLANKNVIKKANNCLYAAVLRLNLSDVFAFDTLKAIEQITKDIHVDGRVGSDKEYCEAFRFTILYSLNTFDTILKNLNPEVLAYIISEMKSKKVNSTCSLYNRFMEHPDDILNMTFDDFRDFVDNRSFEFSHRSELIYGLEYDALTSREQKQILLEREKVVSSQEQRLKMLEESLKEREKKIAEKESLLDQQLSGVASHAEHETLQSTKTSKIIPYKLDISKAVADEIAKYLKSYETYEATHKGNNKYVLNATMQDAEQAEVFLKCLTVDGIKARLQKMNPYALSEAIKRNYMKKEIDY